MRSRVVACYVGGLLLVAALGCLVHADLVPCRVVSCRVVSCRVVSCRIVSRRVVPHSMSAPFSECGDASSGGMLQRELVAKARPYRVVCIFPSLIGATSFVRSFLFVTVFVGSWRADGCPASVRRQIRTARLFQ